VKVELQEAQTLLISHLLQKTVKQMAQKEALMLRVVLAGHLQVPATRAKVVKQLKQKLSVLQVLHPTTEQFTQTELVLSCLLAGHLQIPADNTKVLLQVEHMLLKSHWMQKETEQETHWLLRVLSVLFTAQPQLKFAEIVKEGLQVWHWVLELHIAQ
jgi:hypothetical protein